MELTKLLFPGRRALPMVHEAGDDKQLLAVGCDCIGMAVPEDLKGRGVEYANFDTVLEGQELYCLPPVPFLGFSWMVILRAENDTVISLKATTVTENITETIQAITLVQRSYIEKYGVPAERKPEKAFCLWRSSKAQVTYQVSPSWPYRHKICITGLRSRF